MFFAPVCGTSSRRFICSGLVNQSTFFASCLWNAVGSYHSAVNNADSCNGSTLKSLLQSTETQLGVWGFQGSRSGKKKAASEYETSTARASESIRGIFRNFDGSEKEIETALQQCGVVIDPRLVENILRGYANNWKLAYGFFMWSGRQVGYKHNTQVFNAMINILGKVKQFDIAWEMIEQMNNAGKEGSLVSEKTFRIMFKRYAAAHMVKEAIEAFHRMEYFNLKSDRAAFHSLLDALCEHNHVVEAERLSIGKDSIFSPETKTFNILLSGWCKVRAWSECRRFWKEVNQLEGFHPDIFSYSIYMDALCKSGNPKKALKLYWQMKESGCEPDVTIYNIVVHVLGQANRVNDSLKLLHAMLDTGCRPNVVTYNSVIRNLCKIGKVHKAYQLFEQMAHQHCIPNAVTYHCFFSVLKKPKEVLVLFDKMVKNGCIPTIETYIMLMRKFGSWGLLRIVFMFWNQMEQNGCSPNECAYKALIDALIRRGRYHLARKYNEEMVARGISSDPRRDLFTNMRPA
eukprot:Gb_06907 [translate_table: standard]